MERLVATAFPSQTPPQALTGVPVLEPKGLNNSVYLGLNHLSRQTPWAHGFMHGYALWLGPVLLAIIFVVAYCVAWWQRSSHATTLLALGGIGTVAALGLNQLVGRAAKELRPYVSHPQALVLVAKSNDYAFPSDHSVLAGGLTMSILLALYVGFSLRLHAKGGFGGASVPTRRAARALRVLAATSLVLGLFLCFARVYVGAHYPGDVVAGYLLGAVTVVAVGLLRPVAFLAVDAVDATVLGNLFRRPPTALSRVRSTNS